MDVSGSSSAGGGGVYLSRNIGDDDCGWTADDRRCNDGRSGHNAPGDNHLRADFDNGRTDNNHLRDDDGTNHNDHHSGSDVL